MWSTVASVVRFASCCGDTPGFAFFMSRRDGVALYKEGRSKSSEGLLRRAELVLRREAASGEPARVAAETAFYLAASVAALGRASEAASLYTTTVSLDPQSSISYENLGIVLGDAERHREAASAFHVAVRLAPRAEAFSLLGRSLMHMGELHEGEKQLAVAISLAPASATLHYEVARTDELFGDGLLKPRFSSSQQLALKAWRATMGCEPVTSARQAGAAVRRRVTLRPGGDVYGRNAPQPFTASAWPPAGVHRWPHLLFVERAVVLSELNDVWISGNDGVVSDAQCDVYLPSHGEQLPLHHNLPAEPPSERFSDGRIRHLGFAEA